MMASQRTQNEEFNDLLSSGLPNNQIVPERYSFASSSLLHRIWKRSESLFCSGVFLKGSALGVGLWNPKKGIRAIMMAIVLFLDVYYIFDAVYYAFLCKRLVTPLNSWFCGNSTLNSSSSLLSPTDTLQGVELLGILSLVANFAILISNAAFFLCMWKLEGRSAYCVTIDKAYSSAGRSVWVKLNCSMFTFGIFLLIKVIWFNLTFEEKLTDCLSVSLSIAPQWAVLTSSWIFALITNAMRDCVAKSHTEIRTATGCTTDDIIRIHKRLCEQMSSTSESLKICYCAASVTASCNRMLKQLNMTTDDEWQTGHPFHSRSQLTLFLQYAQHTNVGFQVGDLTFGTSFAWFSTLIAMCGLGVEVL
ncbi:uncharacterized protein [Montipora capricornis]|uniref:uncharacterized protein n=1 Tax=Montipora capricornis TaxID=246305 RepID=UPI0035F217DC